MAGIGQRPFGQWHKRLVTIRTMMIILYQAVAAAHSTCRYWKREPTGKEYVVQAVLGINHGGLGVVAWNDPTTADIKASASALAKALPTMKEYILNPAATFSRAKINRIDVGLWTVGKNTLALATNLNYAQETLNLNSLHAGTGVKQVFDSGSKANGRTVVFESVGSGAFILS
jgi:hypothetical protein